MISLSAFSLSRLASRLLHNPPRLVFYTILCCSVYCTGNGEMLLSACRQLNEETGSVVRARVLMHSFDGGLVGLFGQRRAAYDVWFPHCSLVLSQITAVPYGCVGQRW